MQRFLARAHAHTIIRACWVSWQPDNHEHAARYHSVNLLSWLRVFSEMMYCQKNGSCYDIMDESALANLVESFSPGEFQFCLATVVRKFAGTPFSAFLLAAEICICFVFFASIPNTRKDSVFYFLAIIFASFIVKTVVEVAFFVAIYFYTSSYTFW